MASYEKARIKLLDKNTGQILKEVDPLTTASAVDYDGVNTVKDKIDGFANYISSINLKTSSLEKTTTAQAESILSLNKKHDAQQVDITNVTQTVATQGQTIQAMQSSILKNITFRQFTT